MKFLIEKLKSIIEHIKEFLWFVFITIFGGIIFGLGGWLGIMFAYEGVYWVLGFMAFIMLFHISDFKEFFIERNFLAIIGRFICLYGLSSFICGYIAYASGAFYVKGNTFTNYAAVFSFSVSFIGVGLTYIIVRFLRHSPLYFFFERIINKLFEIGILWRY